MRSLRSSTGFTLIEIIVVLIILGVLASLALPAMWEQVKRSKAAEAFATLGGMKPNLLACIQTHRTSQISSLASCFEPWGVVCGPITCTGFIASGTSYTSPNFEYSLFSNVTTLTLTARKAPEGTPSIEMVIDMDTGQTTCSGTGYFSGVC